MLYKQVTTNNSCVVCTVVRVESNATNPRKESRSPGSLTVLAYNREDHLSAGSKETNDFPESMKNGAQL